MQYDDRSTEKRNERFSGNLESLLDRLQAGAFRYLWTEVNPANGLVRDSTWTDSPASIAAVGFTLAAYPVGVERGFITRAAAVERTLATLRFFWHSPQSTEPDATGYKGFYYHFLKMDTGRRAWQCELSTIDTSCLLAGMLVAARYFDHDNADEIEIRRLVDALYRRADWQWAQNGDLTVTHGWTPEHGFLNDRWQGFDEALLLYLLGLGSPTAPLPPASYEAWASTYAWKNIYGYEVLYAGPLFIHQFPQLFLDFRGIQDTAMRVHDSDYFENSRRSTYIQQQYAIRNPQNFVGYGAHCWGLTASEGPGPAVVLIDGIERHFLDYSARGAPDGPDDGTLSPWVAITALPFAPEIVVPTITHIIQTYPQLQGPYGLTCSLNPTFRAGDAAQGWFSTHYYGLNEAPIVIMIENYRSELLWKLMHRCTPLITGLRSAGFSGGWLDQGNRTAE